MMLSWSVILPVTTLSGTTEESTWTNNLSRKWFNSTIILYKIFWETSTSNYIVEQTKWFTNHKIMWQTDNTICSSDWVEFGVSKSCLEISQFSPKPGIRLLVRWFNTVYGDLQPLYSISELNIWCRNHLKTKTTQTYKHTF